MIPRLQFAIQAWILILALAALARAQAVRFDPVLDNPRVSVFFLDLPPSRRAHIFQNTHDTFWIAISAGRITISDRDGNNHALLLRSGDARFYPSFRTRTITNDAGEAFRAVLVEIKTRGLASSCDCDGAAERAVCGCPRAAALPPMWAVGIGRIVAGGTTLAPGQSFQRTSDRGDTLLVAISQLTLSDDAAQNSARISLRPGEAAWLPAGPRKLRNPAAAPARYVTLEF